MLGGPCDTDLSLRIHLPCLSLLKRLPPSSTCCCSWGICGDGGQVWHDLGLLLRPSVERLFLGFPSLHNHLCPSLHDSQLWKAPRPRDPLNMGLACFDNYSPHSTASCSTWGTLVWEQGYSTASPRKLWQCSAQLWSLHHRTRCLVSYFFPLYTYHRLDSSLRQSKVWGPVARVPGTEVTF